MSALLPISSFAHVGLPAYRGQLRPTLLAAGVDAVGASVSACTCITGGSWFAALAGPSTIVIDGADQISLAFSRQQLRPLVTRLTADFFSLFQNGGPATSPAAMGSWLLVLMVPREPGYLLWAGSSEAPAHSILVGQFCIFSTTLLLPLFAVVIDVIAPDVWVDPPDELPA